MYKKIVGTLGVLMSSSVFAGALPTVNLGLSSFVDGAVPAGPGWYAQTYVQNYSADSIRDANGDKIPLPKSDLDYMSVVQQISYMGEKKVAGGHWGVNMLIPVLAHVDIDDGLNNQAIKAQRGLADMMLAPFVQFDPIMGENGPVFAQRFEFQVNLPTGKYSKDKDINPGANAFSLDPYWAATYWINPKWTVSTRIHYLFNFKNNDPNYTYGDADNIQAGQAAHANFATSYAISPHLRLGVNGYWLKQLTENKVDGVKQKDTKEQVWAIGPGVMYSFDKEDHLAANLYFEQDAKNRPQGNSLILRYTHHFH